MDLDGFRTAVAVAAVGLTISATSASAVTEMVGGGFLSDFNAACGDSWPADSTVQVTMRTRPGGASGNSDTLTLASMFTGNLAMHFQFPEAQSSDWATMTNAAIIGGDLTLDPPVMPRIRHLPAPDGTVLSSEQDDAAHVIAEILHFGNIQDCRARVNVWLHKR